MNSWEDAQITDAVNRIGRNRVVLCGLWTSVCIVGPALSAIEQGFEVYVIADACGDVSTRRMSGRWTAWCRPGPCRSPRCNTCWNCSGDWARAETYDLTTGIAKNRGGGYGLGIIYAKSMFGASEGH